MTTTMTEIREVDRGEMAGVDGGNYTPFPPIGLPGPWPPGPSPYPHPGPNPGPFPLISLSSVGLARAAS
jgi:hypothetical protein